ncbi:MAG: CHAT domain-containing protein [Thermoanaerobaculia bacterium]
MPGRAQNLFPVCREEIRVGETDRRVADCVYRRARQENRRREGAEELASLAEAHPESAWLSYFRARLLRFSDPAVLELLIGAAEEFSRTGDASGEIHARTSLVTFLGFGRDFEGAALQLAAARSLAGERLAPEDRARVLIAEAHYLMLKGEDLERARRRLRTAHETLSAADSTSYLVMLECLRSLVTVSLDLGLQSESHQYAQEAKRLAEANGTSRDRVSAGYNAVYGTLRTELPDDESRRRVLCELNGLLELAQSVGHAEVEAQARRLVAEFSAGPEAGDHLLRCRELARSIRDTDLERRCLLSLASLRLAEDPGEARLLLDQAYAAGLANPGPWALFYGWADHLRVLWETESREQALAGADVVLGAIETLRRAQVGAASNRLLSAWADAYYWQAGRLLSDSPSPEEIRRAFAVIERLRSQELREVLGQERGAERELPADLVGSLRQLDLELVQSYRRLLDPGLAAEDRRSALESLAALEAREAELQSRLAVASSSSPGFDTPGPDLLDRVAEALAPDEALLSFQVGLWRGWDGRFLGGSWLLVVTRSGRRLHALGADRASLEPWIKAFLGLPEPEGRPAVRLFQETVEKALAGLEPGIRKLVLVPDGLLHLLPFATLRPEVESPPLADRFELTLTPSAQLWLRWRGREETADRERSAAALVFANPTLPNTADSAAQRAWALDSGADLGPLPFAEREGKRVARHFGSSTRLLSRERASESSLKEESLDEFDVLHFAAHAVTDWERPQRSAILLAAGDPSEDGFLRPAEIARLDGLDGKLVVLSACSSASGSVLRGEGVLSLARAFFEAGAHAVVGSLWRLDDRQAAAFFEDFYRNLARGQTVSQAVAETQRQWIAEGRPASAWSGIVVLGNGNLVPMPGGIRAVSPVHVVVALAGLGLLVLIGLRFRRKSG